MAFTFAHTVRTLALAGVAAVALLPAVALAQDTVATTGPDAAEPQADAQVETDPSQIIVTGTLVRGIAPPGASPISVNEAAIEATGATSVNDVLESIPQLGSFGRLSQPLAASQEVSVNRPNLRSLPGFNTAGGSTTLVLLDGHRIVGMGTASTTPDPDIIPPGVLQRLEIVPDGGSAIYGSDAVAGVLNFITIKRFDGVRVDGSYGFADDYYRYDGNVTAGRDWGSGSLYASYNYSVSDELLGRDRDYIRTFPDTRGTIGLTCSPGNLENLGVPSGAGRFFGLNPGGTVRAGVPNECDDSDFATLLPGSKRHSVFAGLTQDLSDSINLELRGFYTNRKTRIENGPFGFSEIITFAPNPAVPSTVSPFSFPFFQATGAFAQQVSGRFGADDASETNVELDTWGITPTVTADLDGNFQLRVLGSYGQSASNFRGAAVNGVGLRNAIAAGQFNPFNPTTATPELISAVTNFQTYGRTRQYFQDLRAIVDGDLFEVPGGAVKIAAGLEYFNEEFDTQRGQAVPGFENSGFTGQSIGGRLILPANNPIPRASLDRNVKSAFGELVVPIFGDNNASTGLHSLTVSAAGRFDDYSDVGSTFNPRFGATYKPVEWVSIFGAWGESFNAPSLADDEDADITTLFVLSGASASFFAPPRALTVAGGGTLPNYTGQLIVAQRGNSPDIQPQEATTWNVGFDVQPPFLSGLSFGATYYNIEFNNLIGLPPFEQGGTTIFRDFLSIVTLSPSQALLNAAVAGADVVNGPSSIPAGGTYAFFDARKRNLGEVKLDGIDFRVNLDLPVSFGSLFFSSNGTYELNREQNNVPGAPFIDVLSDNTNRFRVRSTLGAEIGPLLGQVVWNHLQGFDLVPGIGFVGTPFAGSPFAGRTFTQQTSVDDFNTFDLFFKFDVPGTGLLENLSLTLNVENVFDEEPPVSRGGNQIAGQRGVSNGNTLGRLIQFGLSKKF